MPEQTVRLSDAERDQIRTSLRRLLSEQWPAQEALALSADPAAVRRIWGELATLGIPELLRDPAFGGVREELIAFEELGRACCPAPLLGTLVGNLLIAAGADALVGDGQPQAVAFGPFDGDRAAGEVTFRDGRASGAVHFVEGAAVADRLIVFTADPAGVLVIAGDAAGVTVEATPALSLPALASLRLAGAAATFVAVDAAILRTVVQIARLATAARATGSAQRAYELVVEHAGTRKQFGKFIGQFQAVQHRLADNLTRLDAARLTLDAAATAHDEGLATWSTLADLALAHIGPSLRQLAIDMHQLMGAVGYSEEHELPRHFRQIHGNLARFGGAFRARAAVGAYLVDNAAIAN